MRAKHIFAQKIACDFVNIRLVIIKNIELVKRKKYSKRISTRRETALFPYISLLHL